MKKFNDFKDRRLAQIAWYTIFTVTVSFILIHVVRHLDLILGAIGMGLRWLGVIFVPLAAGFAIAYILYPLVGWLQKKFVHLPMLRKGNRARGLATAVAMIGVAAALVILSSVVISAVGREVRLVKVSDITNFIKGLAASIRALYDSFNQWIAELNISSAEISNMLDKINSLAQSAARSIASGITGWISGLPKFFTNLLFAIIFAVYFLLDAKGMMKYWDRVLKAVTKPRGYRWFHQFLDDADAVFSGYIRGQLLDAVIMANLVGVVLSVLNVKFAVIISVLVGIGNLIPYVGPFVAYISTAFVCIVNGDINKLIISIIVLFIVQTVDGNVINPKLLSKSINIHPMLVIIALIIGSAIGGLLGMLLAVPVAALLKMQFDRLIAYLLKKKGNAAQAADAPPQRAQNGKTEMAGNGEIAADENPAGNIKT